MSTIEEKVTNSSAGEDVCPECNSVNIEWDHTEIADGGVSYDGSCNDCGTTFTVHYNLVYVETTDIVVGGNRDYEWDAYLDEILARQELEDIDTTPFDEFISEDWE